MNAEELTEYIARLVDAPPPLTDEQRQAVRRALILRVRAVSGVRREAEQHRDEVQAQRGGEQVEPAVPGALPVRRAEVAAERGQAGEDGGDQDQHECGHGDTSDERVQTRTLWGVRDLQSGAVWWTYNTEAKAVAEAKRFPHDRDVVRCEMGPWEKVDVPLE